MKEEELPEEVFNTETSTVKNPAFFKPHKMNLVEVYYPNNYSMGRLPNDVRTQIIASGEKENALLAKLLLLNRKTFRNISNHYPLVSRRG